MSFLVSDQIQNMQLELNILNQAMDDNDFILFLNRTNEYFGTNYKMPTSERQSDFLMFNGVNEYPLPEDFAGIIEPKRPYGNLSPTFQHQTTKSFVHWPYGYATSFKFDRENQYLVANMPDGTRATLNACDSLTENGTWAASDGASGLFLDNQIYTEGTGSLNFTITAGVDAILTCTGMSAAVDATDYLNQGWIFLDIDCPNSNTTALTSITLRIGSDASNYYEMIATTRYRGDTILNNWGLVGFNMATKTTVGSPDVTGIDYIRVAIAGAETGTYRLDNIFLANAVYFQLPYYSQYNIKADDGTYKAQITAIGDTVLCPNGVEFTGAYTYKTLEIANAMRFKDGYMATYCAEQLKPREKYLKSKYRRQESRASTIWYKGWRFKGNSVYPTGGSAANWQV